MILRSRLYLALVTLILLIALPAIGQKQGEALADSLKKALSAPKTDSARLDLYIRICRAYRYIAPDSLMHYAQEAMPLGKKVGTPQQIHRLYTNMGIAELLKGNYQKARVCYDTAYDVAKRAGDKKIMESSLIGIAGVYSSTSDFSKSLDYMFQAARISEEIHDTSMTSVCYANAASLFGSENNYPKSAEYARKALDISRSLRNSPDRAQTMAKSYECLGVSAAQQQHIAEARPYYDSALAIYQKAGMPMGVANMYYQIATIQGEDHVSVLRYALEAQAIFDSLAPNNLYSMINLGNIGIAYEDLARFPRAPKTVLPGVNLNVGNEQLLRTAESYLTRSIALAKEQKTSDMQATMEDSLSSVQAALGEYKDAFLSLKGRNLLHDSLFSEENKNKMAGVDEKYQVELRDSQIAAKNAVLAVQVRQRWLLIGGLVLLAVIGLLLYRQNRIRKRTNTTLLVLNSQLDEANEVKLKFMGILNHDLRAPVANLINFLHLQKEAPDLMDAQAAQFHSQKIKLHAENLLLTMEDLLAWSKGQMKNFAPSRKDIPVELLFEDLQKHFAGTAGIEFRFDAPAAFNLHTDEHYLKTIMRNLTGNAIKALADTPNALILWKAWEKDGKQYLSLTDNGPGATDQQLQALYDGSLPVGIKSGLGLHLVRDLAKAISCAIAVRSSPGQGTEFQLSL
jgi:signal transduction histidine kinase